MPLGWLHPLSTDSLRLGVPTGEPPGGQKAIAFVQASLQLHAMHTPVESDLLDARTTIAWDLSSNLM